MNSVNSVGITTIVDNDVWKEGLASSWGFIPIWEMCGWGRVIASFSPLTYFTDLVNYCTQENSYYSFFADFMVLIIFTILFLTAVKIHMRTLSERLS